MYGWKLEGESVDISRDSARSKVSGESSLKKRYWSWDLILLKETALPHFALHQASDRPPGLLHQEYLTVGALQTMQQLPNVLF